MSLGQHRDIILRPFAPMRAFAFLIALGVADSAGAAAIGPCRGNDICLSGIIQHGDAVRFAAVAKNYPTGTFVWLNGPGGYIIEALDIGDINQKRGFSTAVSINNGYCGSACALLFLSGRHAIVQRNSLLLFHEGRDATTGRTDPDANNCFADRISSWGVTKAQALALLNAAPPEVSRPGTEAWARSLGFQFAMVPNFLWMWRSCQAKFCVAAP